MATWEDIKEARLRLRDPSGVIDLSHVADDAARPSSPARQTAYRSDDSGTYAVYDFTLSSWTIVTLNVSDTRLSNLIDLYGINGAISKAVFFIIAGLYDQMQIVRLDSGAESTQYQTLSDMLAFYKSLKDQFKEDAAEESGLNTGRQYKVTPPSIGGGMLC